MIATRMTISDFLAMPDQGRGYELIDGELREKIESQESSYIGAEIRTLLREYVTAKNLGVVSSSDYGFRCFSDDPDRVRKPDVGFVAKERITREQYRKVFCPVVPDLVVEVISPSDSNDRVHDKREMWLKAGAKIVWIPDPRDETVRVYRPGTKTELFTSVDLINVEPLIPGFRCLVAEFFKLPALAGT